MCPGAVTVAMIRISVIVASGCVVISCCYDPGGIIIAINIIINIP